MQDILQEIQLLIREEIEKAIKGIELPEKFDLDLINNPEIKVEVPKLDFSGLEKALLAYVEAKKVEINVPETDFSGIQMAIEELSAKLQKPDNTVALIEAIKGNKPEKLDFSAFTDKFEELIEETKKNRRDTKNYITGIGGSALSVSDNKGAVINPLDRDKQIDVSSASAIENGSSWNTGWIDREGYTGIKVSVKTDQNGYYTIQYSPDQYGTDATADSTLTRYYRTTQIEPPHKFENMRRYVKVTFYNNSGSNQTYFRPDISLTNSSGVLNIPIDATMSQDYDSISVRPTDFHVEVALGRRQGVTLWNKFGYNNDVDVGTEVIASSGGTFTPLTTATTLTIVSTSTDDDDGGTGCNSIVVYGINANRDEQIEVITLNGTTNVVTTSTWLGINRVAMFLCGTGQVNAGTLNITATTGGSIMAQMPAGGGVTQQCIFHVPRNKQFIMQWLTVNTLKQAAQNPRVTVKMWVYSAISNGRQEVYKKDIDTSITNDIDENPNLPSPISEQTVVWLEATTDKADTIVNARFSGELYQDVDA